MSRIVVLAAIAALAALGTSGTAAAGPTCSGTLGIANHGVHVTHDYVGGTGGAQLPGGPGAHGHMLAGIAPGASFCLLQSQSPGTHFGP